MKSLIPVIVLLFLLAGLCKLEAQQDPMYTKYMFNSLSYNPAYAGSREYLSVIGLYRAQWLDWDQGLADGTGGAPTSQTLTVHSPVLERVAVGGTLFNDEIGATSVSGLNLVYAYRIPFSTGKLSVGLQAGVTWWRAHWDRLSYRDPRELDPVFAGENPSRVIPAVGAGIYYASTNFYAGFSVPRLFNSNLRNPDEDQVLGIRENARLYRHYYLTAGGAIPLKGDDIVFRPSMLIKSVGLFSGFSSTDQGLGRVGAPTSVEIDLAVLFYRKLWVGAAFRTAFEAVFDDLSSHDSADAFVALELSNGLRVGMAYDFPLSALRDYTVGSLEVMVGYEFNFQVDRMVTPRYF